MGLFLVLFTIVLAASCGTPEQVDVNSQINNEPKTYINIKNLGNDCEINDFPVRNLSIPPGGMVLSISEGKNVNELFKEEEFEIFNGRTIIQTHNKYTIYGKEVENDFYVMTFNFNNELLENEYINKWDVLGKKDTGEVHVMIFSSSLDPFLVLTADVFPVFYAGYYWFSPAFISANGPTIWTSFDEVKNINALLSNIGEHSTDGGPGFTFYNNRIRFQTKINEYPREIKTEEKSVIEKYEEVIYGTDGVITHVTEMEAGGYNYRLLWQGGFSDYLQKEYSLNNPLWLCGTVVTYDIWENMGYIFIRDFSEYSLEEKYEGRLRILQGEE